MNYCTNLWYDHPAEDWFGYTPIGSGRLGAMILGGVSGDRVQLNEDSLWSGLHQDRNNPDARAHLPEIRQALKERNFPLAEEMAMRWLTGIPEGERAYQTAGDLDIVFPVSGASGYRRSLDLDTSVAALEFTANGIHYRREYAASGADNCILVRFTADQPHSITFHARILRKMGYDDLVQEGDDTLCMTGGTGIRYTARLRAVAEGGRVSTGGEFVWVDGADSATLLVDIRTSFYEKDPDRVCRENLDRAARKPAEQLLREAVADYQALAGRMTFTLDSVPGLSEKPTDQRLKALEAGQDDPSLYALYFNFGRYLMISGSRPGTQALTLQGIWNQDMTPAWDSKYTININTEMNYWPVEMFGLPECHLPLFDLLERMYPNGQETARVMYGCRGYMAHHNTDIWGDTAPQDTCTGSTHWMMGAAWLSLDVWTHYIYTLDREFLEKHYHLMRDAALFFRDFLTEDGKGRLIVNPTSSPENCFRYGENQYAFLESGCAMDSQILRELFTDVIRAAKTLNKEDPLVPELEAMLTRLPPIEIGADGCIREWMQDRELLEPGHRHMSHMFALYPSHQIDPRTTPELAKAAENSLNKRLENGGGYTGWSRGWVLTFWARLLNGEQAHFHLQKLLTVSTYPSLLDRHPPFQIDGNFGSCAAICELLLQYTRDALELLPALPAFWADGTIRGLAAPGRIRVDLTWKNGTLLEAVIHPGADLTVPFRYQGRMLTLDLKAGQTVTCRPEDFR